MKRCILFFLDWPQPGKVNARLAAEVGNEQAAALAKAMVEDMLDSFKWVEDADVVICFSPKERKADFQAWLGLERSYWHQRGPEHGRRVKNAFFTAFHKGYDQAVLLGGNIPDVHDDDLRQAFCHLENRQSCALGPSEDGGYWLVGFDVRGHMDEVFLDMDWGSPTVLDQTVRRLEFDERNIGFVTKRRVIDSLDDLKSVAQPGQLKGSSLTLKLARKLLG